MTVLLQKNASRPGSLKRKIDFLDSRDLKKRMTRDPEILERIIANGPAFQNLHTGADMYPVRTFTQESPPLSS